MPTKPVIVTIGNAERQSFRLGVVMVHRPPDQQQMRLRLRLGHRASA